MRTFPCTGLLGIFLAPTHHFGEIFSNQSKSNQVRNLNLKMPSLDYKVELAVQMKCNDCKEKIKKELSNFGDSVKIEHISVDEQRLVLQLSENSPSSFEIQELIEKKLNLNTIIRGAGDFFTAVCELRGSCKYPEVWGVFRFIQNQNDQCLADGVVDGLRSDQRYNVAIHTFGDLSAPNLESIGPEFISIENDITVVDQKMILKKKINNLNLMSCIGRSLAVKTDHEIIASCVIARASKILDNSKKVCACSGKTLWQEREINHR